MNDFEIYRLEKFRTDACTILSPLWKLLHKLKITRDSKPLFVYSCIWHDYLYWKGGTKEQRKKADYYLMWKIRAHGYSILAKIVYRAVRIFGHPIFPKYLKWGYGKRAGWQVWKEY